MSKEERIAIVMSMLRNFEHQHLLNFVEDLLQENDKNLVLKQVEALLDLVSLDFTTSRG